MPPSPATSDWRVTFAFAAAMVLLVLGLKIVSAIRRRPPPGFWLTLLPSGDSFRRAKAVGAGDISRVIDWLVACVLGFVSFWWLYWAIVKSNELTGLWLGWLGMPQVWLMGEVAGRLVQALWLPSGRLLPLPHENIFAARSVADFWGRRWNVWMSDWFRQIIFRPLRRRPVLAMLTVFAFSGVIHELVINLSLWLITGKNQFGSMMIYFGAQAAGVLVERAWRASHPRLQRAFTWVVVLGPAPLIVNEGLLRALHLWP